ncbi:MAG: hypothetical protein WCZ66_04560 [Sphingomonadaceae bacterium]
MPLVANRLRLILVALSGAAVLVLPAAAQTPPAAETPPVRPSSGAPKSLLPDDLLPATPPAAPAPPVIRAPVREKPAEPSVTGEPPVIVPQGVPLPERQVAAEEPVDPLADLAGPTQLPENAGLLTPRTTGYAASLFAGADARFLATLLRRIDSPLASRWAQIMLQRALLSRATPPAGLHPADWLAARGQALVRMGSATDAHRMISRIAIDRYTADLYGTAAEAALASGDPVALCPLATTARALTGSPIWTMADGMCSAVLGDDYSATLLFDDLRKNKQVDPFDISLAERIASAAGSGERGANAEWDQIDGLNAWRIGLAGAAGLEIPDNLLQSATPAQRAWVARLPTESIRRRASLAPEAAALGVLGSAEINRIMAAEADILEATEVGNSPGGQLRRANAADAPADRLAAMEALWKRGDEASRARYGWLIATSAPAARFPVREDAGEQMPQLAAALVAAGMTDQAARWWQASADASRAARARLWAMVVAADPAVPVDSGHFGQWAKTVSPHRAQLLAAGLAGLGHGTVGTEIPAVENSWTQALDRAVASRHTGAVMVLAATGLQGRWGEVHPDYLRRIAAALTAVGHHAEARLIVAEAALRG